MVDHLSQMDIQRWQLRSEPKRIDSLSKKSDSQFSASDTTAIDSFSTYAATSIRMNADGEENCWLWVVPQAKLPAEELQLLDKIVTATQSSWQFSGVADSYLTEQELNSELEKNLSAVVILGDIGNDWQQFLSHDLYQTKRFVMGVSLRDMSMDAEKKRLVWQGLQALM